MGRNRISWDMEKAASMGKQADPYTMNQDHKNNPVEKYHTGDPSTWAEEPDTKAPWKSEGRTETGHPAPVKEAREAVVSARKMEDRALKCITIAQRMLPGAVDAMIEEQATDLMYLPENCILATLQRQTRLAEVLASSEKCEEEKEEAKEEVEAAKKEEPAKEEAVEVEAAKKEEPAKEEVVEVEAAKKEEPVKEEAVEVEAAKKEETEEETVEASDADLLDQIFAHEEIKTGAKKLSGIVKQASAGESDLNSLWDAPPDVSKAFR